MQSSKNEKSSDEQPSSSAASETAPAAEPTKLVDSKRLKMFMSCIESHNDTFATDLRGMLAELYGPVFEDNPRYLEKIQKACLESCMKGFDKKVNKFIETNELDKKLKELEEIAEDPVPGVEKAWRPTGLSAMQQQLARDTECRVAYKEKMVKELEKEEAELKDLMDKALKYREQYEESQEKLVALEAKANNMWDETEELEKSLSKLEFDETPEALE